MAKQREADVVIIGAGITGAGIARELSKYKIKTIVVEKTGYITGIQTKASLGTIYVGLGLLQSFVLKSVMSPGCPLYDPESPRIKFLEEGFEMWPQVLQELDIEHKTLPVLVAARNEKELRDLEFLRKLGEDIGRYYADMRWVDRATCFEIEPHLTKEVIAGLYSDGYQIRITPWELTLALSDNAKQNGAEFILDAEVTGISKKNGYQVVETAQGPIKTKYVVNAAGLYADVVADMAGARDWGLAFVRNQLVVLDRRVSGLVRTFLNTPMYPGVVTIWSATLHGNVLLDLGNYVRTENREDLACYHDEDLEVMKIAKWLVPEISEKDIIRTFVGMRAFTTRDPEENVIEPSTTNPKFINVAVRLPGLTSNPAIAKYVVQLLGDAGLGLVTKADFDPYRKAIPRFRDLSNSEREKLIAQDARYGHVVCRCETVTEGEIVEAIRRGARTVTEVKYRTRAGMGRCQGGFCGPRVVGILARELNIPVTQITDLGLGSPVVPYKSKELLREATRRVK